MWDLLEPVSGTRTGPHPTTCRLQSCKASGRTATRTDGRTHTQLSATSKHAPWHGPVHQRDKARSTCRREGTQPTRQEAYTSLWTYTLTRKQMSERGGTVAPWPIDRRPRTQKDRRRQQRCVLQTKRQDKSPQEQLTEQETENQHEKELRLMIGNMVQKKSSGHKLRGYKKCLIRS